MSVKHTTGDMIARSCFGVVLGILACIGLVLFLNKVGDTTGQAPIRALQITIDKSQKEELYLQLWKFADKNSFKILIRDVEVTVGPSGKGFFIEMHRSDIQITGIGEPSAPIMVSISFYDEDSAHPAPKETVDELSSELKNFISEIPSVTISEEE